MSNSINIKKILKNKQTFDDNSFCYVYFLLKDDKVVYVGKTLTGLFRIKEHQIDKDFDSFAFFKVDKGNIIEIEADNVFKYKPIYNKSIGAGYYYDRTNNKFYSKNSKIAKEKNKIKTSYLLPKQNRLRKKVIVPSENKIYNSITEFAKEVGVSTSFVSHCLKRSKLCKDYLLKRENKDIIAFSVNNC